MDFVLAFTPYLFDLLGYLVLPLNGAIIAEYVWMDESDGIGPKCGTHQGTRLCRRPP